MRSVDGSMASSIMSSDVVESIRTWIRRPVVWLLGRPRLTVVAGAAVIGFPAVMAVVRLAGQHWYPTGDFSHTELLVRSIPQHPPLVGVAARVGDGLLDQGSTPGPSMAYLLYPIYLLGGRTSISLVSAVLVLHLVAVASSLYVTWRLGGWRATWAVGLGFAVVVRALAPEFFLEPWNVWVPLLAFALFILLIWGIVLGHHWFIVGAVIVGTHCVQTHVSYIPLVVGLLGFAVIVIVRNQINGENRDVSPWAQLIASSVALVVMWLPPIIEQLTTEPGNLGRLWRHFSDPAESMVGVAGALRAMAGEFNLAGPFVVGAGHLPTESPNLLGTSGFAMLVILGIIAGRKSGDRRISTLQGVLAVSTIIGFIATTRIFGYFYEYVIRWMWVLAMLWMAVSVWALISTISTSGSRRLLMGVGCALGVALIVEPSLAGATPALERDSRVVQDLSQQLERSLDPTQRYLLRWHDPAALGGTGFGLVLSMEKRGFPLFVDAWAGAAAQKHRVRNEADTDAVLCLEVGSENIARFGTRGDVRRVAEADPRSESEVEESAELRAAIERGLRDTGRSDLLEVLDTQYGHTRLLLDADVSGDVLELLERYNELRLPAAAFIAPQGSLCIP